MVRETNKTIHIRYYALLREERGLRDETIETKAQTPLQLYDELCRQYGFTMSSNILRVAINDTFQPWDIPLSNQDTIVFIPPVAGG